MSNKVTVTLTDLISDACLPTQQLLDKLEKRYTDFYAHGITGCDFFADPKNLVYTYNDSVEVAQYIMQYILGFMVSKKCTNDDYLSPFIDYLTKTYRYTIDIDTLQKACVIQLNKNKLFANLGLTEAYNNKIIQKQTFKVTSKRNLPQLEENIERHDFLNPILWQKDTTLKSEVRNKLLQIIDEFIKYFNENKIEFDIKDIILVGSNCSYNYTEDSDLDIHILIKDIAKPELEKLYNAYKSLFNIKHTITIYGIPVEVYIEMTPNNLKSNGIYSILTNNWLKKPVQRQIPEINLDGFNKAFNIWETEYINIIKNLGLEENYGKPIENEKLNKITDLINALYELRKVGLATDGEYSMQNLIFKEFRNRGYLDTLKDLKNKILDDELSLTK